MKNYKEKYEQAFERAKDIAIRSKESKDGALAACRYIFPELEESEDEKTRKSIIEWFKTYNGCTKQVHPELINSWIVWLEKQGEQKLFNNHKYQTVPVEILDRLYKSEKELERLKQGEQNIIIKELIAKQKVLEYPYVPGWRKNYKDNKPQVKHSVLMLTTHGVAEGEWLGEEWCQYRWSCKIKDEDVLYWLYLSDLENLEREIIEQKPTDKVEPKFKVGDWIVHCNEDVDLITGIEENGYLINKVGYTPFTCEGDMRLWTIQDAKDGDVLCCENGWTCIFKTLNSDMSFSSYCFMDKTGWFCEAGSESHTLEKAFIKAYNGNFYPAIKEQCDLLFQKMKEAGYEWDAEKKELKKIEQKSAWNEKDIMHFNRCLGYIEAYMEPRRDDVKWFKSLKERVQPQPKQEWSERDEQMINCCFTALQYFEISGQQVLGHPHPNYFCSSKGTIYPDEVRNWFKSIKERMKGE